MANFTLLPKMKWKKSNKFLKETKPGQLFEYLINKSQTGKKFQAI